MKIFKKLPKIDNKYLLLAGISKEFEKVEDIEGFHYYHFILENNMDVNERFGVWANGILTELPSKKIFFSKPYEPYEPIN
jgi:hypothetical protein